MYHFTTIDNVQLPKHAMTPFFNVSSTSSSYQDVFFYLFFFSKFFFLSFFSNKFVNFEDRLKTVQQRNDVLLHFDTQ